MNPATSEWNAIPSDCETEPEKDGVPTTIPEARPLAELVRHTEDDPKELLNYRFLCRGGGLLIAGPTGIGKSAFGMQCALLWSIGKPCMGIAPAAPLKSLIIQAENDDGDLAEMRDGVLDGLGFTPVQTKAAGESVIVCREDSRSGLAFFIECVQPLLEAHKPDLLWIDPALSYLGGESNSQRDVGTFLRNWLNPVLREFGCAAVVVHHTNKPPSGKEKPEWSGSDFAYLGTGSAEWANWPRAVLAIRATGQQGIFELRAGKRGSRLGWRDEAGDTALTKFIAHSSKPGVICWQEVDSSEVKANGRPKDYDENDLFALLPPEGLLTAEWQKLAKEELGFPERAYFRGRKSLEDQKRVIKTVSKKWQPVLKGKLTK